MNESVMVRDSAVDDRDAIGIVLPFKDQKSARIVKDRLSGFSNRAQSGEATRTSFRQQENSIEV